MTAPVVHATSGLVAGAFLGSLPGIDTGKVSGTLPEDQSKWAAGFVVYDVIGGPPRFTGTRWPVLQLDFWATSINSDKPPWGVAVNLAETVIAATLVRGQRRDVALRTNFPGARVLEFYPLTEPRKLYGDPGGAARVQMDCQLVWAVHGDA